MPTEIVLLDSNITKLSTLSDSQIAMDQLLQDSNILTIENLNKLEPGV